MCGVIYWKAVKGNGARAPTAQKMDMSHKTEWVPPVFHPFVFLSIPVQGPFVSPFYKRTTH
jgi:hypothetical protein